VQSAVRFWLGFGFFNHQFLRMEKLSSHFMGHLASFPFNWYCTEMCREYMLRFSPVLGLAHRLRRKVYINGSTLFFRLGLFFYTKLAVKAASFQVQSHLYC
jgi:hypothetical protein